MSVPPVPPPRGRGPYGCAAQWRASGFGPPPGLGSGGPGFTPGPGPKRRTGLIIGIVVLVVLLVAAAVVLVVVLMKGDSDDSGDSHASSGPTGAAAAPSDASVSDFCAAYKSLDGAMGMRSGDDDKIAAALHDWARRMEKVGTPEDITDDERKGYEVQADTFGGLQRTCFDS